MNPLVLSHLFLAAHMVVDGEWEFKVCSAMGHCRVYMDEAMAVASLARSHCTALTQESMCYLLGWWSQFCGPSWPGCFTAVGSIVPEAMLPWLRVGFTALWHSPASHSPATGLQQ